MGDGDIVSDVDVLHTGDEVRAAVRSLAEFAAARISQRPITVVPILDAAVFFAVDFMRECNVPEKYLAPVKVSRYPPNWQTVGLDVAVNQATLLSPIKTGTDLILLDTVIDTGESLALALGVLPMLPRLVCAVVIKTEKCKPNPVFLDNQLTVVSCFHTDKDPWLVGYGMDDNGRLREAPWIGEKR